MYRYIALHGKGRPQAFMAANDLVKSMAQSPDVQRTTNAIGARDVVVRAAVFELIQKPKPLLRKGER
nr:hypothetical protein [Candidatus Nitrotoga arctica]